MIDAFCVGLIAFVVSDEGLDELAVHQLDCVTKRYELAGLVLGTAAGLHADQARRSVGKTLQQLVSLDLLVRDDAGVGIAAVDLKYALRNVDANDALKASRIRHEGLLLNVCNHILVLRCRKDRRSQGGPLPYCSSAVAHTQTRFGTNGTALASLHQHQSPGRRAASPIRSARPLKRRQQPVFGEGARHRSCAAELADRCCRQSGSTDRSRILARAVGRS